jgi:Putative metal-binding motif
MSLLSLMVLVIGCDFSAATTVEADSGATVDGGDGGGATPDGGSSAGDGGGQADGGGDTGPLDPLTTDDDGDGYSEADGDCDDSDPTLAPGREDGCDDRDEDCDGEVDEDAAGDSYEPNDSSATALGDAADGPYQIVATLHEDGDRDVYSFELTDDAWSIFELEIVLSAIPSGLRWGLQVDNTTTGEEWLSETGEDSLSLVAADQLLHDDSGSWEIVVWSADGASCSQSYLLSVELR